LRQFTLVAFLLVATPFVGAQHEQGCVPGVAGGGFLVDTNPTDDPDVPHYYVHLKLYSVGPLWDLWIYEESNGLDGLQRGDEVEVTPSCGHGSDTIIF
jgi:hypothetical protein